MLKSLVVMVKCRWREFIREPSAFFFVIFMPIIWMAILGYTFSGKTTEKYGVGWLQSTSPSVIADQMRERLQQDSRFRLYTGSDLEVATLMQRGVVQLIVNLPDCTDDKPGMVHYLYDVHNREALRARALVNDSLQAQAGRQDALLVKDSAMEFSGSRYVDFLVPGLVALSIMSSSLFGTGALIVVNRRENLLKRYCATPMRPALYMISHMIGRGLMLAVEVSAILLAGWLLFDFQISGSWLAFAVVAICGTACFTALTLICASRTSNMAVMNGFTNLLLVPFMLLGGVWFARSNFPLWLNEATSYLPLTALADALRRIALEGAGLAAVRFEVEVLGIYALVCGFTAKRLFKWY